MALKLQQWRTEEKIIARGVGGRAGYSHMNPSREEGKMEPRVGGCYYARIDAL